MSPGTRGDLGGQRASFPAALALAIVALALVGPWLTPDDPDLIAARPYGPPGAAHPLGTDHLGRDVLSQTLAGGRSLLLLPVLAVAAATAIGTAIGAVSAYLGGWLDAVTSWAATVLLSVPPVVVLLVLLAGWGSGGPVLVAAIAFSAVPFVSRLARAAAMPVVHAPYVELAAALGESRVGTVAREIVPNIAAPILADAGLRLIGAIYLTAAAAFLGFAGERPSWGAMIGANLEGIALNPWAVLVPAALLSLLAISANRLLDLATRRLAR